MLTFLIVFGSGIAAAWAVREADIEADSPDEITAGHGIHTGA